VASNGGVTFTAGFGGAGAGFCGGAGAGFGGGSVAGVGGTSGVVPISISHFCGGLIYIGTPPVPY
jgi:hypothetical protein